MRESAFLKVNSTKWKEFEKIINQSGKISLDQLADLYIELTDDLAYAQTNYPDSTSAVYLNGLLAEVHQKIYKNKKENKSRFLSFWKYELPFLFGKYHKQLLYSFLIFFISCCMGAISAAYDESFIRLILGDAYVNMTLENIEKGDPMGVYKSHGQMDMFSYITMNNIKVSFLVFVLGIFCSVGTGYILFYNGVMLGSFQYFFYQKGLLATSALAIWIHGTLEISAIIIAGCAGIVMGNGILFPKTYTRLESLKRSAKDGIKIVIGLVPIFITAGFLESFVTRHTEMSVALKLLIILTSAFFIIYYFLIYPIQLNRKIKTT